MSPKSSPRPRAALQYLQSNKEESDGSQEDTIGDAAVASAVGADGGAGLVDVFEGGLRRYDGDYRKGVRLVVDPAGDASQRPLPYTTRGALADAATPRGYRSPVYGALLLDLRLLCAQSASAEARRGVALHICRAAHASPLHHGLRHDGGRATLRHGAADDRALLRAGAPGAPLLYG